MLTLLVGGARSGKSALAVDLARRQTRAVTFVATGRAVDADMAARIDRHRQERPASWTTIEESIDLLEVLRTADPAALVIVDCLSLWTSTAMAADPGTVETLAQQTASAAASRSAPTVVVTNEVGMGVHPTTSLGREYRDIHGRVNAIWATAAQRAWLVVSGQVLALTSTAVVRLEPQ